MKSKKYKAHTLFAWPVIETKDAHVPNSTEREFLTSYVKPADIHVRRDIFSPEDLKEVYKNPVKSNIVQNFISRDSYVLDDPKLKKMKASFQSCVDHYCYEILKMDKHHKFYITQSSMNYNHKGTGHHFHFHPNSIISSVYYLQVPKVGAPITFYHSKQQSLFPQFEFNYKEWNEFNSMSWWIPAIENSLLLFPSTLRHGVNDNTSDTPRISMSFNVWAENLGEPENLNEIKLRTNTTLNKRVGKLD